MTQQRTLDSDKTCGVNFKLTAEASGMTIDGKMFLSHSRYNDAGNRGRRFLASQLAALTGDNWWYARISDYIVKTDYLKNGDSQTHFVSDGAAINLYLDHVVGGKSIVLAAAGINLAMVMP